MWIGHREVALWDSPVGISVGYLDYWSETKKRGLPRNVRNKQRAHMLDVFFLKIHMLDVTAKNGMKGCYNCYKFSAEMSLIIVSTNKYQNGNSYIYQIKGTSGTEVRISFTARQ